MAKSRKEWYVWSSESDFNSWHEVVIESLGLPIIGKNAATGEESPDSQATTSYTILTTVSDGDYRAQVEDNIAELFAEGLGELSSEPQPLTI